MCTHSFLAIYVVDVFGCKCRRAEPIFFEDHHLALKASFYARHPSLDPSLEQSVQATDPVKIIYGQYDVVLPLLLRVLQQRSEMLRTHPSRVTPLSQLCSDNAILRFNASGTKTLQEGHDPHDEHAHWDKILVHTGHGEGQCCGGPEYWIDSGVPLPLLSN